MYTHMILYHFSNYSNYAAHVQASEITDIARENISWLIVVQVMSLWNL